MATFAAALRRAFAAEKDEKDEDLQSNTEDMNSARSPPSSWQPAGRPFESSF